jgi:N-acetylglucosamine malate deacetylase 2
LGGGRLLHVTNGAPRNLLDARAAGFVGWQDYAAARRQELLAALRLAGIEATRTVQLGMPDQEASFRLVELAAALAAKFSALRPEVVMTHAYEGGHPDHDATAFAVHTACALVSGAAVSRRC